MSKKIRVTSGVGQLDRILQGLFIGDNVIWYDDAGSLSPIYCLNFMQASLAQNKHLIYVSFDRSPTNLLEKLGSLANNPFLTILDCFTCGKGENSQIFLKFYDEPMAEESFKIIKVEEPNKPSHFAEVLYGVHETMEDDVRLIFESLTGMQELWGGEEYVFKFYSHSCPRLYELNTIAYWIMERSAHSERLRAQINQIAQVVIDLSIKRGTTSLTIIKAENRNLEELHKSHKYWTKDLTITLESENRKTERIELGLRLKQLRTKRGLSQAELAKLVGITPSTISQVETNLIYPSLPALFKMAEVLSVDVSSLLQKQVKIEKQMIFPEAESVEVKFPGLPDGCLKAKLLTPIDFEPKAEPYIIEILPNKTVPSHFFIHKGNEIGYMLSGRLRLKVEKAVYTLRTGDVIYLTNEMPIEWRNPGKHTAKLLWFKVE
jgi:transcriptional regulator with XRE-family HTH domain